MEANKVKLELTQSELDIIEIAVSYFRIQKSREIEIYQQRIKDPNTTPNEKKKAVPLLDKAQRELELLKQVNASIWSI